MVEKRFLFRDARDIEDALKRVHTLPAATINEAPNLRATRAGDARPFLVRADRNYSVAEFCAYDGPTFVRAAYLGLLGRRLDPAGGKLYLSMLANGVPKVMVLSRIHYSTEGRNMKVRVDGASHPLLFWRACEVPVIATPVRSRAHPQLPTMSATVRRLEYICSALRSNAEGDQ